MSGRQLRRDGMPGNQPSFYSKRSLSPSKVLGKLPVWSHKEASDVRGRCGEETLRRKPSLDPSRAPRLAFLLFPTWVGSTEAARSSEFIPEFCPFSGATCSPRLRRPSD